MFDKEDLTLNDIQNEIVNTSTNLLVDLKPRAILDKARNINMSKTVKDFWVLLSLAKTGHYESAVDDFIGHVFKAVARFGKIQKDIFICGQQSWKLIMTGQKHHANPDIVVRQITTSTVLIVHEDKSHDNILDDPFAQVVAEAIAYYQNTRSLPDPFPILLGVCQGTCISFMEANLTAKLAESVRLGIKLQEPFLIQRHWDSKANKGLDFTSITDLPKIMQCLSGWHERISKRVKK